jgi:peptidoglycan biosynthesis protein MviN/MurJ (putative lipid II flippase)
MLIGQALMNSVNIVDQFFAAHLGPGALSTLGYANRILALVLGLGATVISRASLPVLSRAHVKDQVNIGRIANQWGFFMLVLGLGVMLTGLWLAPTLVELIFERGEFTAQDTAQVAEVLRYALIQVPFYFASMIFVFALLSLRRHRVMVLIAGFNILTKIGLAFILVPIMGLNGLVLATAGVYLVGGTLALVILRQ